MKKLLVVLGLTLLSSICSAEDPQHYDYQKPKQIDCQEIHVDETYVGGNVFVKKICFYEIEFGGGANNQNVILWHEVDSSRYGFINKKSPSTH